MKFQWKLPPRSPITVDNNEESSVAHFLPSHFALQYSSTTQPLQSTNRSHSYPIILATVIVLDQNQTDLQNSYYFNQLIRYLFLFLMKTTFIQNSKKNK